MTKEELQRKYFEFQLLDQQLKQIQEQIFLIQQQIQELESLNANLDSISKTEKKSEILSPLGAGVFIKTELKENKEVLMNIGAKTAVLKTIPDAKKLIALQVNELKRIDMQLNEQLQQGALRASALQEEVEQLSKEKQN